MGVLARLGIRICSTSQWDCWREERSFGPSMLILPLCLHLAHRLLCALHFRELWWCCWECLEDAELWCSRSHRRFSVALSWSAVELENWWVLLRIKSAGLASSPLLKNTPKPPHFLHWFPSLPQILCAQPTELTLWVAAGVKTLLWKNWECSKAVLLYLPWTVLTNTSQCSSTYLLSASIMLCLLAWDKIIQAMLIARILGYLCQTNCCGITVLTLS